MTYSCIACDSQNIFHLGVLPVFTRDFLGAPLDGQVEAGSMYRCLDCSLQFRAPAPSREALAKYYGGLSSDACWQHGPDREVWREIREVIQRAPERSILDVGCFRGDLLVYLGPEWERFGVEPSIGARDIAQSRGITIIADSIESLPDAGRQFGAITLVDVMEHLLRPLDALRKLVGLLKPGGQLVIFTGNTAAWSWRFAGLHYWYSAMPEHVAFFSPRWFEWAAAKLGCRVSLVHRLRYQPAKLGARLDETLKNVAYVTYRRLESLTAPAVVVSRLPILNRIGKWEGCWWTSARDHFLVVLTKE
jgi:SAM-dependent methyltransferase